MEALVTTFGLDWKLLLAQALNFFLLLAVLRYAVYRPLLALMKKRQGAIEAGLLNAEEAEERLASVHEIQIKKTKEAEEKALGIIHAAEARGKTEEKHILTKANEKEREILLLAEEKARAAHAAALLAAEAEAVGLVKQILVKTVSLSPGAVDDALIKKAAEAVEKNS